MTPVRTKPFINNKYGEKKSTTYQTLQERAKTDEIF
jgi:hypothetical protein